MIAKVRTTLIILAGGQAKRMGGADKGLILFAGQPMIQTVLERVTDRRMPVVISANRNFDLYARYGVKVVSDEIPGFCGPLAGIASALNHVRTDYAVTLPCDCPFVPRDYVERMQGVMEQEQGCQCAAVRAQGIRQPVFMILRREMRQSLLYYLEGGGRKVGQWLDEHSVRWIEFNDLSAFKNINTIEELKNSEKIYK